MFLKSATLTNVRSIEKMALDFTAGEGGNRKWTILLGENGCGKSTVLRALALVLAGTDALAELIGEPDAWIRNGASACRIEAVLETADGESRELALSLSRGDTLKDVFSRNSESLSALDAAIAHAQRNYFVLAYGVSRRPPSPSRQAVVSEERSRSPRARGMSTMFAGDASLVSLEQWAMDLEYRHGAGALAAVRKALKNLLPGMDFKGIDRQQRRLLFRTSDGVVPLSQLSDGYQNMAAWCGDLLYRITEAFPDRKKPLETRGVLLIDELDLHLHPVWRRKLVEFLDKTLPNFQIVATTHSALAAQQCGPGELYVIRREGSKARPTLVPFVGEPRKMMLHQLLLSPMFGVPSLDSTQVESSRDAIRKLSETPVSKMSATQKTRLKALRDELADTPDWDAVPQFQREQTALLKDVKKALFAAAGTPPKVSASRLRAKVKALSSDA